MMGKALLRDERGCRNLKDAAKKGIPILDADAQLRSGTPAAYRATKTDREQKGQKAEILKGPGFILRLGGSPSRGGASVSCSQNHFEGN